MNIYIISFYRNFDIFDSLHFFTSRLQILCKCVEILNMRNAFRNVIRFDIEICMSKIWTKFYKNLWFSRFNAILGVAPYVQLFEGSIWKLFYDLYLQKLSSTKAYNATRRLKEWLFKMYLSSLTSNQKNSKIKLEIIRLRDSAPKIAFDL